MEQQVDHPDIVSAATPASHVKESGEQVEVEVLTRVIGIDYACSVGPGTAASPHLKLFFLQLSFPGTFCTCCCVCNMRIMQNASTIIFFCSRF